MRFLLCLSLLGLGITVVLAGSAGRASAGAQSPSAREISALRADVDHYRELTWTFQRAAHEPLARTTYSDRRTTDVRYLDWTLARWERIAYTARAAALARLRRRIHAALPHPPRMHAVLAARIAFSRRLTVSLRRIYPGKVTGAFLRAQASTASKTLQLWQLRSAAATLAVDRHRAIRALLDASDPLVGGLLCIHRHEGAWTADTGNGYFGGLQMDWGFMRTYGGDYLARWGTADAWPAWAQIEVAERAYRAGRGFEPWPNTARACGLL